MSKIPAGTAIQNYSDAEATLDFNRDILVHPESLVYAQVEGNSMEGAGIYPGTLLIVDRAGEVVNGCLAVICVNDELMLKKIERQGSRLRLISENPDYESIELDESQRVEVFGIVDLSINCHRKIAIPGIFRVR
jgi:DNA polymerase V